MQELIVKVIQWGVERGIFEHSNPTKQIMKSASELGEIIDAIAKEDMEAAKLEIGDFMVTLILYCGFKGFEIKFPIFTANTSKSLNSLGRLHRDFSVLFLCQINDDGQSYSVFSVTQQLGLFCLDHGFDQQECLQKAYDKISNRQTKMVNGVAVK